MLTSWFGILVGAWIGLSVSMAAPPADFTVESPINGAKFRLSEAKGKFVAVHFLLKTECPFCLRQTREYAQKAGTLTNVVQVFLKPDSADEIKQWAGRLDEGTTKRLTIYRDADAALAKAYDIPFGYRFHGEVVHYPALVLLDPQGREVFRHVGKNNADRFGFDALAAKVAELGRQSVPR